LKPRYDDPDKFCDNVRKSWRVMHEAVRQITDKCFITYLEPNPGVGYDYPSLTVSRGSRPGEEREYFETKFMLNRNGQSGLVGDTVFRDIWETTNTEAGIKTFANDLIDSCGLNRTKSGDSQSVMARVCQIVTKWIDDQTDCSFCVAPPFWPGGCTKFEPSCDFSEKIDEALWPRYMDDPYLSLGIRHVEVARIGMTDASLKKRLG